MLGLDRLSRDWDMRDGQKIVKRHPVQNNCIQFSTASMSNIPETPVFYLYVYLMLGLDRFSPDWDMRDGQKNI